MLKPLAVSVMLAGAIAVLAPVGSAEARPGARSHHGRTLHVRPFHYRHYPRFRAPRFYGYVARPVFVDRCHWLKRRALATGSRYWWQRYRACRY